MITPDAVYRALFRATYNKVIGTPLPDFWPFQSKYEVEVRNREAAARVFLKWYVRATDSRVKAAQS